jgi:phosphoribosylformylglycinamidine cyclo-ligase
VLAARASCGAALNACAHITGGGIVGNLPRVLPDGLGAVVRRDAWDEPRIFEEIRRLGAVDQDEMDRVFNCGIGMVLVVDASGVDEARAALAAAGQPGAVIGEVAPSPGVQFA